MTESCTTPLSLDDLVRYQLAELDAKAELSVEMHYLSCAYCSGRLEWVQALEPAIAEGLSRGQFDIVLTRHALDLLERTGAVIRKYELGIGESVNCTIAPKDDAVVVTLRPPSRRDTSVTIVVEHRDHTSGQQTRHEYGAFQDPRSGEIHSLRAGNVVHQLGRSRFSIYVRFGEGDAAETVGPFTMNHSPWSASE